MQMPTDPSLYFSPILGKIRAALPDEEIYLVGGAVRDALLGRISHDLDFALPKKAIATARRLASSLNADFYILDEPLDMARVIVTQGDGTRDILDFAAFRGADLASDLAGRDFTMNAIAMSLDLKSPIDPLGGVADLQAGSIHACSETSLTDDPIRILRAVRLAAAFGFKIEQATFERMQKAAHRVPVLTAERVRDEVFKILDAPQPDVSLRTLDRVGVLPYLTPELEWMKGVEQTAPHVSDVWEHTLNVIHALDEILDSLLQSGSNPGAPDPSMQLLELRIGKYRPQLQAHFLRALNPDRTFRSLLLFAALYHDVSKPATQTRDEDGRIHFYGHDQFGARVAVERGRALKLGHRELDYTATIIQHHMRFHFFHNRLENQGKGPTRRSVYRFFLDAGEGGVDLVLLGLADLRGMRGNTMTESDWSTAVDLARLLMENYWEKPAESIAPPRLMDGNEVIQAFRLEPGPRIGKLLAAIREAQATGRVSTREEALAFGSEWLKRNPN